MRTSALAALVLSMLLAVAEARTDLADLPPLPAPAERDWLVADTGRSAGVFKRDDPRVLVLDNGLVLREFLLGPNAACVGFTQLTTGQQFLRAVGPECTVSVDGRTIPVGGLTGQPVGNYILPEWFDRFEADPDALAFRGFEVGPIEPVTLTGSASLDGKRCSGVYIASTASASSAASGIERSTLSRNAATRPTPSMFDCPART